MSSKPRWCALLSLMLVCTTSFAQGELQRELRTKFEAELKNINESFHGVFGAQFVDLTDGQKISINADSVMPTASTIKVAILVELFRQADQKPDLLKQQRPFAAKDGTGGSGMARLLGPGSMVSVKDIAKMMINLSENT